jgi:hypothetical protein
MPIIPDLQWVNMKVHGPDGLFSGFEQTKTLLVQ